MVLTLKMLTFATSHLFQVSVCPDTDRHPEPLCGHHDSTPPDFLSPGLNPSVAIMVGEEGKFRQMERGGGGLYNDRDEFGRRTELIMTSMLNNTNNNIIFTKN